MHAAPSVSYPVGRSRLAGLGLAAAWLLGAAAILAWAWQGAGGWRPLLAAAVLAACGALAARGWWRSPAGALAWDGVAWRWSAARRAEDGEAGQPELALDLQAHMLLRWTPAAGRTAWLWVARQSAPSHWDALRRAVYSRASTAAAQGAEPPVAQR